MTAMPALFFEVREGKWRRDCIFWKTNTECLRLLLWLTGWWWPCVLATNAIQMV